VTSCQMTNIQWKHTEPKRQVHLPHPTASTITKKAASMHTAVRFTKEGTATKRTKQSPGATLSKTSQLSGATQQSGRLLTQGDQNTDPNYQEGAHTKMHLAEISITRSDATIPRGQHRRTPTKCLGDKQKHKRRTDTITLLEEEQRTLHAQRHAKTGCCNTRKTWYKARATTHRTTSPTRRNKQADKNNTHTLAQETAQTR